MSDFIFLGATVVFFAICALYVKWCDMIVGPDDFKSATPDAIADVSVDAKVDEVIR